MMFSSSQRVFILKFVKSYRLLFKVYYSFFELISFFLSSIEHYRQTRQISIDSIFENHLADQKVKEEYFSMLYKVIPLKELKVELNQQIPSLVEKLCHFLRIVFNCAHPVLKYQLTHQLNSKLTKFRSWIREVSQNLKVLSKSLYFFIKRSIIQIQNILGFVLKRGSSKMIHLKKIK